MENAIEFPKIIYTTNKNTEKSLILRKRHPIVFTQ